MRKILIILGILGLLVLPVRAWEGEVPEIPEAARPYLEDDSGSFGERLLSLGKNVIDLVAPNLKEAGKTALAVLAVVLLCGIFRDRNQGKGASGLLGVAAIGLLLLNQATTFINLGLETVQQLGDYGGLLLPVMSGALVASGGAAKATALYVGTAFGTSLLSRLISQLLAPMVTLYLGVSLGDAAISNPLLGRMRDLIKSWITWGLKLTLYGFTAYMTITGLLAGNTDAIALRATKLTISGAVPVVGGILSDASEALLVGAGTIRSTVGIGGLLVLLALAAAPFIQVGAHYLLLKLTATWSSLVGEGQHGALVSAFADAMGLVLAMVGTCCLFQLISVICFMKGI